MVKIPWGTDENLSDFQFFNRKSEITLLKNILETIKEDTTPSLLITGKRGVGKTALLKHLSKQLTEDYLVCYINLTRSDDFYSKSLSRSSILKLFYHNLLKSAKKQNLNSFLTEVKKYFKTNKFTLDKVVNIGEIPVPIIKSEEDYSKLANFVFDLPQSLYDKFSDKISGVIIIIDEFQYLKELEDYKNFLWNLRSVIQSQKNVAYIFSGSIGMKHGIISDINGSDGAFGGRMLNIEIKPFSKETTKNYLNEKVPDLEFTNDGFERFYKCTMGIPFYINTFARLLPKNILLDSNVIISEFKDDIDFIASHLKEIWISLNIQEQEIIVQLLNGPLKRGIIAKNLNVKSGAIGGSLNKLLDKNLIEHNEEGYYLTEPILKFWLNEKGYGDKFYPYRVI